MAYKFICAWMLVIALPAHSCRLTPGTSVVFERNSAAITPKEKERLEIWAEMIKSKFPHGASIDLEVHVENTEHDFKQLGRMRELAVRIALVDLAITADEFYPSEKIYADPPGAWGKGRLNDVKRVSIQYSSVYPCPSDESKLKE